jgi:plastocyanin
MRRIAWLTPIAALAIGCGGSSTPGATLPPGYYITISGMAFRPLNLDVPPGATVTVLNRDTSMLHSVTSQAAAGAYVPGGVGGVSFDTGAIPAGQATFTVPAAAAEGTVVPYYCSTHGSMMVTPNGTITVRAAAQPEAPAGGPPGTGY